jgi:hypothetical protein
VTSEAHIVGLSLQATRDKTSCPCRKPHPAVFRRGISIIICVIGLTLSDASNHMPSLAVFTTTTPELKFSVHTGDSARREQRATAPIPALGEHQAGTAVDESGSGR